MMMMVVMLIVYMTMVSNVGINPLFSMFLTRISQMNP